MKLAVLAAVAVFSLSAHAQVNCIGSGSFQTCTDLSSGNTYNIQRSGSATYMQGHNSATGSSWNQNSQTMGNMTISNGTASNGQSWNNTTISSPGLQQHYGSNSQGQTYNKTCNQYGCF
jgi:hypothetical protein